MSENLADNLADWIAVEAELTRLRAENAKLRADSIHYQDRWCEAEQENVTLRAALEEMIEISKRNSEAALMLIAIRTCAQHALKDNINAL